MDTPSVMERAPLDEALEIARKDPKQGSFFYDAFLNVTLYVPVQIEGAAPSWKKLGDNEKFFPMFLTHEGKKVIPAFNSFGRLQHWAEFRALDYMVLPCHKLLTVLAPGLGMALNLGVPWAHYFTPETLIQLRDAMKTVDPV